MTDEDDDSATQSSGGMSEHLQRYKNYINNLKKGKSSGISAAFGRATELLPPELFEIKPPSVKDASAFTHELNEQLFDNESDRSHLKAAIEELVEIARDDLVTPIGVLVRMPDGKSAVTNVFVEGGQRVFVLANGKVIDERAFNSLSEKSPEKNSANGSTGRNGPTGSTGSTGSAASPATMSTAPPAPPSLTEEEEKLIADLQDILTEDSEDLDESNESDSDSFSSDMDGSAAETGLAGETGLAFDESNWDDGWPELSIDTTSGARLWNIYYDGPDVRAITMSDGSSIRRAEGRPEFVLALRNDTGASFRFFVLDGLIVDPSTGNFYVEANEGAYSAAFLNNGWILHQYRTHDGSETYYASEPRTNDTELSNDMPSTSDMQSTSDMERSNHMERSKEMERATSQVLNLTLDVTIGEVTFDTLDGSASMTLTSRIL